MKKMGKALRMIWLVITVLAALLSLSVATYAWFTANRVVNTDLVSAAVDTDEVELLVSSTGGTAFSGAEEGAITQVNAAAPEELMPVSTVDLQSFVYVPATAGDAAESFQTVTDEAYYYHGRVYLQAVAEGQDDGALLALYLDQTDEAGGILAQAEDGLLLNAARLGLAFDSDTDKGFIFYLSETNNAADDQIRNTYINGELMEDGVVLKSTGSGVEAVADPALPLSQYTVTFDDTGGSVPDEPLLYMELNRIYTLDIWFYLEGCDPDCSASISFDGADLHLAFYGILTT